MTDREKLAGLLIDARETADMKCLESGCTGYCVLDSSVCDLCFAGLKADHLLSNGVTFPKEAHWIISGDWGECSNCHEASKLSVMEHKDYCPACGAQMIEEVETDGR